MSAVSLVLVVRDGTGVRHERCAVSHGRPILIGRGWHCDIILQDAQVDAEHAELRVDELGELLCVDLESLNGGEVVYTSLSAGETATSKPVALPGAMPQPIDSGATLRFGRSRLAVYRTDHEVGPAVKPSRWDALRHSLDRPLWTVLCVAVLLVAAILVRLTETVEPLSAELIVGVAGWLLFGCGLWVLFWGLLGKLWRDSMHLRAHLSIAACAGIAGYVVAQLGRFIGWQLQSVEIASFVITTGEAAVMFLVLVLTLGVATRLRRRAIMWLACLPGIMLLISVYVVPRLGDAEVKWFPELIKTSYPPGWQIAPGESLDNFVGALPALYDRSARRAAERAVQLAEE